MADTVHYTFPSPLEGYENLEPLTEEKAEDGKSLLNLQTGIKSSAYTSFPAPLDNGRRGGFDVHIYYIQRNAGQTKFAQELHERIRREFPELRIYRFWDRPVGPHPVAMFEVNLLNPVEFGAFVPWLAINRGPLSVLIHPNTVNPGEELRNHSQRAIWMGERFPLDLEPLKGL
ncbi:DOPA-like domain-containing protein [Talaromyces proteolyticus]|uniref:DOPA-like domain-containing protein n=1 Tax=Talaromyces proteolyticus TaxID=1131652 RepID=A0AAD4KJ16_9EURO|nr:DOPA-like domain-containing protein [Talaromyces proteolyticus]KAH8690497.1 DOPA-like domain-containing protein [Talaromyces proteolyticus]